MTHAEFLEIVEKCRAQRGALSIIREAGRLLEEPPRPFAQIEKLVQDGTLPARIDRAVR
jgi:hypothetical protein